MRYVRSDFSSLEELFWRGSLWEFVCILGPEYFPVSALSISRVSQLEAGAVAVDVLALVVSVAISLWAP